MAEWRSNGDRVQRALVDALAAGLGAAGAQYADRVGRRLAWGYTSGRFVTGHVAGSVETTPVTYLGADGRQFVTVVSTGGGLTGSEVTNDEIIAFALPKR